MAAALGVWLVHLPALFDKTRFRGAARDCGGLTRAVLPPPPRPTHSCAHSAAHRPLQTGPGTHGPRPRQAGRPVLSLRRLEYSH